MSKTSLQVFASAGLLLFSLACQSSTPQRQTTQISVAAASSGVLNGFIDLVNGVAPAQSIDPSHPIPVKVGEKVLIDGWLMFGDPAVGITMDEVYGIVNDRPIKAEPGDRPDVRDRFHNPKSLNSGFHLDVQPQMLSDGVTRIDIVGRTKDGKVFRFPQSLYLLRR